MRRQSTLKPCSFNHSIPLFSHLWRCFWTKKNKKKKRAYWRSLPSQKSLALINVVSQTSPFRVPPPPQCGTIDSGSYVNLTERNLQDAQKFLLMHEVVQPVVPVPYFMEDNVRFTHVAVDVVQGKDMLFHIIYLATGRFCVWLLRLFLCMLCKTGLFSYVYSISVYILYTVLSFLLLVCLWFDLNMKRAISLFSSVSLSAFVGLMLVELGGKKLMSHPSVHPFRIWQYWIQIVMTVGAFVCMLPALSVKSDQITPTQSCRSKLAECINLSKQYLTQLKPSSGALSPWSVLHAWEKRRSAKKNNETSRSVVLRRHQSLVFWHKFDHSLPPYVLHMHWQDALHHISHAIPHEEMVDTMKQPCVKRRQVINNTHMQLWFNPSLFSLSELRGATCLSADCLIILVWHCVMFDLAKCWKQYQQDTRYAAAFPVCSVLWYNRQYGLWTGGLSRIWT